MSDQTQAPQTDPSTKRTLYAGISVIVLLAIAIGVAAVRPPDKPEPISEKPVVVAEPTASVPATQPAFAATTSPAPTSSATGGMKTSKPAAGKSLPEDAPKGAPKAPAADGAKLTSLTAPPVRTLGMLKVPEGFTSASYNVQVKPYGWGPRGSGGLRLIVMISSAAPIDEEAIALKRDFANRNATVWVSQQLASTIKLGGTYTGTMVVRRQDSDLGVLYLTTATPK